MYTLNDVAKCRSVNGVEVPLTDDERLAICAEWNANEAARQLEHARADTAAALTVEAKADIFIDKLRGATPQQIKDYVQAQVNDLPTAKAFIGKLACAVAYALNGGSAK